MSKKVMIGVAILAAVIVAYLVFFRKKTPSATGKAPPASTSKQQAQQSLTGKLEDAGIALGVTAATDWLSSVDW